jgi:2-methylaconitate cis-trans-isomerase PrpF
MQTAIPRLFMRGGTSRGAFRGIGYPSGESVALELDENDSQTVSRSALLRTARPIMWGEMLIPASVWDGRTLLKLAA